MIRPRTPPAEMLRNLRDPGLAGALARYRLMANIVGVFLIVLVFIAVPLQYGANMPGPAAVIGAVHGIFYIVYLAAAYDLGRRSGWRLRKLVAPVFAGFVPFLAFVVKGRTTRAVRSEHPELISAPGPDAASSPR